MMKNKIKNWFFAIGVLACNFLVAQTDTVTYTLTIREEIVNKAGEDMKGMTINGGIPGPVLEFTEGNYAVIYVRNEMSVETSVHWHGILLPNFEDGVPYLTTPPIEAGTTHKFEFLLKQSGTYWYHSHTMLQEQSGVFGTLVIHPREETLTYDKEQVLMLSDWTNQQPKYVLKNLKRGNEWYDIKKGTAVPLNRIIAQHGLSAQLNFWKQRMESADIADVYYNAFLTNGKQIQEYPQYEPGEKVRVRIIDGSASTQFWITISGGDALLVSADGLDVVPVVHNKTFIAIAETYDFILTIPNSGKIEIRAMAQDGSGVTTTYLGTGPILQAEVIPRPNKIEMMKNMAKMDMRMGAPAMKFNPSNEEPKEMMEKWGMNSNKKGMNNMHHMHSKPDSMSMNMEMDSSMNKMKMFEEFSYDFLKAKDTTVFKNDKPVREILLNLNGNMWRYIWSINGVPLSESDKIKIEKGAVVRITLNNLSMMHHPMHLHGHFFRVINKNGVYSPLKHTVNVPPMEKIVIEFDNTEAGDWFFHCHVLYHMMAGMARAFRYDTLPDPRMAGISERKLFKEGNHFYNWGTASLASHMTELDFVSSNIRNQFNLSAEYGWNKNIELEFSYERYLYDYFRVYAGLNSENENENQLDTMETTAIFGVRFLTPYMFNLDFRIDNLARTQIALSRAVMILPRTMLFGEFEYLADYGLIRPNGDGNNFKDETTWSVGLSYFLSRNFSLMASYDNRFGAGGGLQIRF